MNTKLGQRGYDQSGQAMTEYLVVVVAFVVGATFFYKALPLALANYTHAFFYMWSRPIPWIGLVP